MKRVITENSVYQLDEEAKTFRKLLGFQPETPYIAAGRHYEQLVMTTDRRLVVCWGYNKDKGALETTMTSIVQEIEDV